MRAAAAVLAALAGLASLMANAASLDLDRAEGAIRVATFNTALARRGAGLLLADIAERHSQVMAVAEIILLVRPDVILLNEFDHDPEDRALGAFADLLAAGVGDAPGLDYPYRYHGPSNTGEPTGFDLDSDGDSAGPEDAYGYGLHPGHYGMALLSRLPIEQERARSYRLLPWAAMPGADRPMNPDGTAFHDDAVWQSLRLSSKSHWIVPLTLPDGDRLDILAAHPTPPVFDGPENRNGRRNADEIRLLAAMIDGAAWLVDDTGAPGGLDPDARFVVLGDLNADPNDGAGHRAGLGALLGHPRVQDPRPAGPGGAAAGAGQGGANALHGGAAAEDTADFRDSGGPGNLRVDYVLPSSDLTVTGGGVFWPAPDDPLTRLIVGGGTPTSSDHRLVWVDVVP